jgi:phosphatidylglycerophosphatase A
MARQRNSVPSSIWYKPLQLLAFGLGSGASPYAPGTAGTLLAIPLYLLLAQLPAWQYLAITLLLFIFGCWLCDRVARDIDVHDHPGIVFDEIVGYLVTMFLVPTGWWWLAAGFAVFRLFDILKPWPIRWLDRHVQGGLGIMLDDLLAGVYGALLLHIAVYTLQ